MSQLTLSRLAAAPVTYSINGFSAGETLQPVRWDDGLISWQSLSASGKLAGHWIEPVYVCRGQQSPGCLAAHDRIGSWAVVPPTEEHLRILEAHAAPHRNCSLRLLVGGVPYEGDYGPDYKPILVEVAS